MELYAWQRKALDIYNGEADSRKIHWFWEPEGNQGKTAFAKHICLKGEAIYVNGKAADCKAATAAW